MDTRLWFTSDTHFFHFNIIKYCNRPFANIKEMEEIIIEKWNSRVKRGDLIYHLGDFAFTKNKEDSTLVESLLNKLNGSKHLIIGNHDKEVVIKAKGWASVRDYKSITWKKKNIVLFHYPIKSWMLMHRGSWHLHGHCHGNLPQIGKSLDVGVDCTNYQPISFDEVVSILEKKCMNLIEFNSELEYQI